jgi:hypothetical protein
MSTEKTSSPKKTFGLLVAVLVGLVAVPVAAWGATQFEAEEYSAAIKGVQTGNHVFGLEDSIKVQCEVASFAGAMDIWSETEQLAPKYEKCTASGGAATVTTNGCLYELHAGEEMAEPGDFEGTLDLECPAEKTMVIASGTCEVQIGSQNGLGEIEFDDNPAATPDNFTAAMSLTKVKYTKTVDGALCPLTGTGAKEDGTYSGTSTITGEFEAEEIGVKVAQAHPTMLCKKEPKPSCAAGDRHPAGTKLEGKVQVGDPVVRLSVKETEGGEAKSAVACETSQFTTELSKDVGSPTLPLKEMKFIFGSCKLEGTGTACTLESNSTFKTGWILWDDWMPFSGHLSIDVLAIHVKCGTELKCQFEGYPVALLFGEPKREMSFSWYLKKVKTAEEKNCHQFGEFGGRWKNFQPNPLYVSK